MLALQSCYASWSPLSRRLSAAFKASRSRRAMFQHAADQRQSNCGWVRRARRRCPSKGRRGCGVGCPAGVAPWPRLV